MTGLTRKTKKVVERIGSSDSIRLIVFTDEDVNHAARRFPAASLLIAFLNLDFDTLDDEYWLTCAYDTLEKRKLMSKDGLVPVICNILGNPERCSKKRLIEVQCRIADTLKDVLGEKPEGELSVEGLNALQRKLKELAEKVNEIGMEVQLRIEATRPADFKSAWGHHGIFEEFVAGDFGVHRRSRYPRHDIVVENINEMRSIKVGKKSFDQFDLIHLNGVENFFLWLLSENLRTKDFYCIRLCQGYRGGSGRWEKCEKFFLDGGETKAKKYCSQVCKIGYHNRESLEHKRFSKWRKIKRNNQIAVARRLKREGKSIDEIVEKTGLTSRRLKDARLF
jgi:hypothetical protein